MKMIFLFEIQGPLEVLLGIAIITLGLLLLKNNSSTHMYAKSLNRSSSILIILLGILILFGYAKVADIINQFIDKFH